LRKNLRQKINKDANIFGHESKHSHSMSELMEDCDVCEENGVLKRVPTLFSNFKRYQKKEEKVGNHVKNFIEEAKVDLKKQKEELKNKND
jgi:hypothetical protein